jgi:hypothetical protein
VHLKTTRAGILALCLCAAPHVAAAQTMQWTDKGYASVNVGVQVGSHTLSTASTFSIYEEDATVATSQKVKGGGLFEIGGAYRLLGRSRLGGWGRNLLGGVFFSHTSSDTDVTVNADIPSPQVFGELRHVSTSQSGARHSENVVHLDAIWMIPVAEKLDVGVFAGPSIFSVKQDTVQDATVTEPGPTVSTPFHRVSKTNAGINFGADLQYMLPKHWLPKHWLRKDWAVGGTARYTWGSAKIDGSSKNLTVGGFQLAVGVRYRF